MSTYMPRTLLNALPVSFPSFLPHPPEVLNWVFMEGTGLGEAAQPHVVHNIALQSLVQLLVHHGNTIFQSFLGNVYELEMITISLVYIHQHTYL